MILNPSGSDTVTDPLNPTIIMGISPFPFVSFLLSYFPGADTIHPAPGANGKPSYTALVGNIDSHMVKYVAGEA